MGQLRGEQAGANATRQVAAIAAILIASALAFLPLLDNAFVNWDDPLTIQNNPHLAAPGLATWAFTTREMGHYQPLAWLVWSQTKTFFGLDATAFHGLSLLVHLLNAALVYLVCVRLQERSAHVFHLSRSRGTREPITFSVAAIVAAFTFAVHPIRVEAVAWASAFPYVLSLTFLLAAFLAYVNAATPQGRSTATAARAGQRFRVAWLGLSIGSYALSQLTRASAIGFPLVLLAVDAYPLRRRAIAEKLPFVIVALAAAVAESHARELATLQEVGFGARLTMAAAAPFVYLGRTLLPLRLSPLDPLPIEPRLAWLPLALGMTGLAAVTLVVWRKRTTWPALAVAWVAYVLLLGPAMGLTPSGQQATADRYMYIPGVTLSLLVGMAIARTLEAVRFRMTSSAVLLVVATALGLATWRQTTWWKDSVTLWTRAAEIDSRNDIATYNLAIALAEAGREEEAISRYEQTLWLVPDHEFALHNLNLIRAARAEREADRLAQALDVDAAIDWYARALVLDPTRLHARAARGRALIERGRFAEAVADLRVAFEAAVPQKADTTLAARLKSDATTEGNRREDDLAVANALAFALVQVGRSREALEVLRRARERYPDDVNVAHNLARLLATAPDPALRDGATALQLALEARDRTGGQDPRVLDTLAAAYATTGQFDLARETADRAVTLARQLGDLELARDITANAKRYLTR
jgi:tetratricopeptide (TPR) repeat protein